MTGTITEVLPRGSVSRRMVVAHIEGELNRAGRHAVPTGACQCEGMKSAGATEDSKSAGTAGFVY